LLRKRKIVPSWSLKELLVQTQVPLRNVIACELAPLLAAADRDETAIGEVVARHELDIDFGTIPVLAERHGLRLE